MSLHFRQLYRAAMKWRCLAVVIMCGLISPVGSLTSNGGSCTADSHCASGDCRGSICCSSRVTRAKYYSRRRFSTSANKCTACLSTAEASGRRRRYLVTGYCKTCPSGYWPWYSSCRDAYQAGKRCYGRPERCVSGLCKGSGSLSDTYCCSSSVSSTCTQCDSTGACTAKKPPGSACGVDADCLYGRCKGGVCCKKLYFNANECEACRAQNASISSHKWGGCDQCSANYYATTSSCYLKYPDGRLCYKLHGRCKSGNCKGFNSRSSYCCKPSVTSSCSQCDRTGACTTKLPPGSTCSSDSDCLFGRCLGQVCCMSLPKTYVGGGGRRRSDRRRRYYLDLVTSKCTSCKARNLTSTTDLTGGICLACSAGFYPSYTTCRRQYEPGRVCYNHNHRCTSGVCRGATALKSKCCSVGVASSCPQCGIDGACTSGSATPAPTRPSHHSYVHGSNSLKGVSLADMNTNTQYQNAFKTTVAQYAMVSPQAVYITGMTGGGRRSSPGADASSVTISWMIGMESEASAQAATSSLRTHMTSGEANFVASLRQAGLTTVTDVDVITMPVATKAQSSSSSDGKDNTFIVIIVSLCAVIVVLCGVTLFTCCYVMARPSGNVMTEVHMAPVSSGNVHGHAWCVVQGQSVSEVGVHPLPVDGLPQRGTVTYARTGHGFEPGMPMHQPPVAPPQYSEAVHAPGAWPANSSLDKD